MIEPNKINQILLEATEKLDISKEQYKFIKDKYNTIGNLLAEDRSALRPYNPKIQPQGSFLLGTIINSTRNDIDLDVDVVCKLNSKYADWTQKDLKEVIGEQIKSHGIYAKMLEEGNRCWTIQYAESTKFHLDILPALDYRANILTRDKSLSEDDLNEISLKITDKTKIYNYQTITDQNQWPSSNPFGYAKWFEIRCKLSKIQTKSIFRSAIEPTPDYIQSEDKPILTKVVQLLKRHRDVMFENNIDKPISIIITTLAGLAYKGEQNLYDAFVNIVNNLTNSIENDQFGKTIILNPVNPNENFADKWIGNKVKEFNFYNWIAKLKCDINIFEMGNISEINDTLEEKFGIKCLEIFKSIRSLEIKPSFDTNILTVRHRQIPKWANNLSYKAVIECSVDSFHSMTKLTPHSTINVGKDIFLKIITDVPKTKKIRIFWQVVNTGPVAEQKGDLRGEIFELKSLGWGGINQKEHTQYIGSHWVQCFITENNICIAKSKEFFVNVK